MFKNPAAVVVKACNTIIKTLDIVDANADSLLTLSLAGNAKADFILKAANYDVAAQSITLDAKIAKLTAKVKS